MAAMILFFSEHCPHCRMLLESVKRYDGKGLVRLYNLDVHPRPAQITSVPSMLLMPSKQLLLGKAVFDYLLLPSRGVLVSGTAPAAPGGGGGGVGVAQAQAAPQQPIEPIGFQLDAAMTTQAFSFVPTREQPHEDAMVNDRALGWGAFDSGAFDGSSSGGGGFEQYSNTPVRNEATRPAGATPLPFSVNADTREQKSLPDMDSIRMAREKDLRDMGIN